MSDKKLTNKGGAPTKYKIAFNKQVEKLCLLGATDAELADFFEVSESTINNWKIEHPRFLESIKKGKNLADATVAESLYKRANGYEHKEDKIFNDNGVALVVPTIKRYAPDTTAAIFWLKNRQPKMWRDRQEVSVSVNPIADLLKELGNNTIKPKNG